MASFSNKEYDNCALFRQREKGRLICRDVNAVYAYFAHRIPLFFLVIVILFSSQNLIVLVSHLSDNKVT